MSTPLDRFIESQIETLLEEDDYYQFFATSLKPAYLFKQMHRDQMKDFFKADTFRSQLDKAQNSITHLLPTLISAEEFAQVKAEFDQSGDHFSRFTKSIEDSPSEKPILFQEMFGLSDATLLHIYALATDLVEKENYQEASDLFVLLTALAPHVENYWVGHGVCLQALNLHEEAISMFSIAKLLNRSDPIPFWYSMESYQALQQKEARKAEIEAVKEVIKTLEGEEKTIWEEKFEKIKN